MNYNFAIQNECLISLVSLAAVFWMSRSSPKKRLRGRLAQTWPSLFVRINFGYGAEFKENKGVRAVFLAE